MSSPVADPDDQAIVVGVVTAAHGVRGEVRVSSLTDVAERFRPGVVLGCEGIGPLTIESSRPGTRSTILRFRGYAHRADAEALRGRSLTVSRAEARRAVGAAYLWADLLGLRAFGPAGEPLGTLTEVIRAGETDVLVVSPEHGAQLLVPALESVVREVDLAAGRIVLVPQEQA